jgi:ankyrin repeat protein
MRLVNTFEAIAAGDEEGLRELLEALPERAGERNAEGLSPVLHALYNGQAELVDVLLEANPALDVFDAAAVGRTRGVEDLLDAEPELSRAWSPDGFTALHYAAFFGQEDTAKILVERGADLRVVSTNPEIRVAPLQSAAAGGHDSIVELLLEHGAELDDLESDELRARYAGDS